MVRYETKVSVDRFSLRSAIGRGEEIKNAKREGKKSDDDNRVSIKTV